jgi:hypothetical protein
MQGEDVALLQAELALLREAGLFDGEFSAGEVAEKCFSPTSQEIS